MRPSIILDGLGLVLMLFSVAFLGPLLTGLWFGEDHWVLARAYGIPVLMCVGVGLVLRYFMHGRYEHIRSAEALLLVSVSWLVIAVIGALPYIGTEVLIDPLDAYFESMSGFTSTGSTVLTGLGSMPKSLLMWRSLTQWIGGMGVIVLSVAVLSRFFGRGAGSLLMQAEVPGHAVTRMAPRMAQTARLLWAIYVLFTALEVVALLVVGHFGDVRVTPFDAICHAFTTLPGGGFGTHDASIAYWDNPALEFVVIIFMMAGATSFVLHYRALHFKSRTYLRDPEFRFWLLVVAFAVVFVTGDLTARGMYSLGEGLRYSSFSVVSLITTTGYVTADYALWPTSSQAALLSLVLMGGMMGSTSGALKMTRVLIVVKSVRVLVARTVHPHAVVTVKVGDVVITPEQVASTLTYMFLYVAVILVGTVLVSLPGVDLATSLSANITCIGNTGPGLAGVGPATTFTALPALSKLVLTFVMWLGRLEILGCLLLFNPRALRE